jgi:hypothetical protein
MSKNLDKLLTIIKADAELCDKLNTRSAEFRYKSIQRLILEKGKPFLTRVKSPFKGKQKACFKNCFQAMWEYREFRYCEGFATDDELNLAISHAWLVNENGDVIDPTWDENITGCTYFGVVFNREFVIETATITKHYGILNNDLMNGHKLHREGFPPHALHSVA